MKMAVGPECACANGRRRKPDGRAPRVRGKDQLASRHSLQEQLCQAVRLFLMPSPR